MKKQLLRSKLTAAFLCVLISTAGAQTWSWAKEGNSTTGGNYGMWLNTDPAGNVFQAGYFNSSVLAFGTYSLTKIGSQDAFLTKYDANGNVLWSKSAGGNFGGTSAWSVTSDAAGNAIITGMFQPAAVVFGTYTLTNAVTGSFDMFVVKYDPGGNVVWAKNAGGTDNEYGYSIDADAAGNTVITGSFGSASVVFGAYTLTNSTPGIQDVFVVKYDSNGNVLWAHNAGGNSADRGFGICADPGGNAFVTGYFDSPTISFGTYTLTNTGGFNMFLAKYGPGGNVLWATSAVRTASATVSSVSADNDGSVYVTGSFTGPTIVFGTYTLTNNSSAGHNTYVVKYDATGNVIWARSIGGSANEDGYSVCVKGGAVFVSGTFQSPTLNIGTYNFVASGGPIPVFIARYDLNGNVIYATTLTSGGVNTPALTVDNFCNVYITGGFSYAPFILGSNTLLLTVPQEEYIAKFSFSCLPLGINENKEGFVLFQNQPNPAPDKSSIHFQLTETTKYVLLTIYDARGIKVFERRRENLNPGDHEMEINTGTYSAGVYYYTVEADGKRSSKKMIVE